VIQVSGKWEDYLECSQYVDYDNEGIRKLVIKLTDGCEHPIEITEKAYHFVRDEIRHSWDIQDARVTVVPVVQFIFSQYQT
jgi:hypothetical protein